MTQVVFPIPPWREKESCNDNNNKSLLPSMAGQARHFIPRKDIYNTVFEKLLSSKRVNLNYQSYFQIVNSKGW